MVLRSTAAALLCGALLPLVARGSPAPAPLVDEPSMAALALALAVSPTPSLELGQADPAQPEVELTATVRAAAVTFAEVPRIRVSLAGAGPQHVRWRTERINLPAAISPGTEYRDVTVRLVLAATPAQLQALLADARALAAGIRIEPRDGAPAPAAPASDAPAGR